MKKKIIISVSSDLATDQRVQKVAKTCHENNFDVLLVGRKLNNSFPVNFPYNYKRLNLIFNSGFLFYAELNIRLFFLLLFSSSDILLSNDTDTLLPNYFVSKIRNKKLIFDAHELFPEVPELADRPFVKKVWEKIEDFIFPKLKNAYTVSQSIATYYGKKYGIEMKVVRNVPYHSYLNNTTKDKQGKTIIYQGAINKGRGLEWVIQAMPKVDGTLIVAGDGDIKHELEKLVNSLGLSEKVFFIGKKTPCELKEITLKVDLGLCLLEDLGLSYYYSLPNRIFDYIQAEIPVLATDFPEIRNIVDTYKTGVLINQYDAEFLAKTINNIFDNGFDTSHFYKLAQELNWENEERVLLEILNSIQEH